MSSRGGRQNDQGGGKSGIEDDAAGIGGVDLAGGLYGDAEALGDAARRGRGRPKGAMNKHTSDFEGWYYAQGFTDPLEKLGAFVSADPVGLWLGLFGEAKAGGMTKKQALNTIPSLFSIIREQHGCAKELAPYLHGKKPLKVQISDERLPQLMILTGMDQNEITKRLAEDGALALGSVIEGEGNEINDLAGENS